MKQKPKTGEGPRKIEIEERDENGAPAANESRKGNGENAESDFRFEDRRHWVHDDESIEERTGEEVSPRKPTLIDEYRERTEEAERRLQEYIEAFKGFKQEQEQVRDRLNRDVDRRVELKFGTLVNELLEAVDNLDLALEHVSEVPEAAPLAQGVELARRRFLETLERHGVEKVDPMGQEFDPNEAEAVRVDPVDDRAMAGKVTQLLRPGYRLGERIIRPARVAVGHHDGA